MDCVFSVLGTLACGEEEIVSSFLIVSLTPWLHNNLLRSLCFIVFGLLIYVIWQTRLADQGFFLDIQIWLNYSMSLNYIYKHEGDNTVSH